MTTKHPNPSGIRAWSSFTPFLLKRKRFTLIELLVVVAIIAILAAMLLPVLSKAKHYAKLAVCMNNQKQAILGVIAYAGENDDFYPERREADFVGWNGEMRRLKNGSRDARPILREIFPIDEILNDPLGPRKDPLDTGTENRVIADYILGWGWGYDGGEKRMRKVGDRFTYKGKSYSLLIGDFAARIDSVSKTFAGHRDNLGLLPPKLMPEEWGGYNESRWQGYTTGKFDLNYGFDDGSVQRYTSVSVLGDDPRVESIGGWVKKGYQADFKFWVPLGE